MKKAMKKRGKLVQAYLLGDGKHPVISELISTGKIKKTDENEYELFSQESVNGTGQRVTPDYYVRIDSAGYPYPNSPEFVKNKLRYIEGDDYEQISCPVDVWTVNDGMCPEIEFLINNKDLVIDNSSEKKYFNAPLWGTILSAGRDAYVVFYEIQRNTDNEIIDVDFNFVEKNEFEKTYVML